MSAARDDERYQRIARVIGGVIHEALRTTGTTAVVLLDVESPEGALFSRIAADAGIPLTEYSDAASTLTAHPANKTALLVGDFFPRADLLPLGDLYATQVQQLSDGWTGDQAVDRVAEALGGIDALDAALQDVIEGRSHLADLERTIGTAARQALEGALRRSRFRRARAGVVPKLGRRSIGVDLLD